LRAGRISSAPGAPGRFWLYERQSDFALEGGFELGFHQIYGACYSLHVALVDEDARGGTASGPAVPTPSSMRSARGSTPSTTTSTPVGRSRRSRPAAGGDEASRRVRRRPCGPSARTSRARAPRRERQLEIEIARTKERLGRAGCIASVVAHQAEIIEGLGVVRVGLAASSMSGAASSTLPTSYSARTDQKA